MVGIKCNIWGWGRGAEQMFDLIKFPYKEFSLFFIHEKEVQRSFLLLYCVLDTIMEHILD